MPAVALLLAGCGGADDPLGSSQAPSVAGSPPAAATGDPGDAGADGAGRRMVVYLLRDGHLAVAARTPVRTRALPAAALEAVLAGPTAPERAVGLTTAIPAGTDLLGLEIRDGRAVVDLSAGFSSGGDSAGSRRGVAQVVHTLTQWPTVDRVELRVAGAPIAGRRALTRADGEDAAPAILIEQPAPGEQVRDRLRLRGTADTFEGSFVVRLRDAAGRTVLETSVQATSGSGERGSFEATLPFDAEPGPGVLVAFEPSAEDGSEQRRVEVPLHLGP